jgi:hypothetical protein
VISIGVPMIMSRRWRQGTAVDEDAEQVPYGPSPAVAGASPAAPAGRPAEPEASASGRPEAP